MRESMIVNRHLFSIMEDWYCVKMANTIIPKIHITLIREHFAK